MRATIFHFEFRHVSFEIFPRKIAMQRVFEVMGNESDGSSKQRAHEQNDWISFEGKQTNQSQIFARSSKLYLLLGKVIGIVRRETRQSI